LLELDMDRKNKKNINWKVVIYSIVALISLALTYFVNWLFIIPVGVLIWFNQRELIKKK
jgi:hypothetical protein